MTLVLPLAPIVARLQAECAASFREIGDAANFGRAMQDLRLWPTLYILPLAETASASPWANEFISQSVTMRFSAVIIASDARSASGREALSALEVARAAVLAALSTWPHPAADGKTPRHERGRLISDIAPSGALIWQDDYAIDYNRTFEGMEP